MLILYFYYLRRQKKVKGAFWLSGKTIAPFCTSGGSGINASVSSIRELVPDVEVLDGQRFSSGASQDDVAGWLARLGLAG